jgi:competence protein ComGC
MPNSHGDIADEWRRRQRGLTLIEVLIGIAVTAAVGILIAVLIRSCTTPDISVEGVKKQVQEIAGKIISNPEVSKNDVATAADQVARGVIKGSLDRGKTKEELRTWCNKIIEGLTDEKRGKENAEKAKLDAAIDAVKKACDELLKSP